MNELSGEHKSFLKKQKIKNLTVLASQIGLLLFFLLFWELAAKRSWVDAFLVSSPSRIWKTLVDLNRSGQLFLHIWISLYETVLGFVIGTLSGALIAVALWWSQMLRRVLEPYVVVLNSLPKIALGPILIVWFGTGQKSIVAMAVLISVVVTTLNMLAGFLETNPQKVLLLETMNACKFQVFTKLVFPANLSTLISALKINVGMAWIGTIMGEYLSSRAGLGYLIVYGSQVFRMDLVMACTVVLCTLAGLMYALVAAAEKRLVRWKS